jgi:hypothetical protein
MRLVSSDSATLPSLLILSKVSGDGYIHSYLPIIPDTPSMRHVPDLAVLSNNIVCEISRQECLGFEAEPAWDLFKRALVNQPSCGDCCELPSPCPQPALTFDSYFGARTCFWAAGFKHFLTPRH